MLLLLKRRAAAAALAALLSVSHLEETKRTAWEASLSGKNTFLLTGFGKSLGYIAAHCSTRREPQEMGGLELFPPGSTGGAKT